MPFIPGNSASGDCFPIRVTQKEGVGRCVVAVRDIGPGKPALMKNLLFKNEAVSFLSATSINLLGRTPCSWHMESTQFSFHLIFFPYFVVISKPDEWRKSLDRHTWSWKWRRQWRCRRLEISTQNVRQHRAWSRSFQIDAHSPSSSTAATSTRFGRFAIRRSQHCPQQGMLNVSIVFV